ncbi:MAG: 4-alpha-glucanotransferase [Firmicutes bacterium]|nr:4-alpha-glucanotransferase [Bacillota bacterium]
MAHLKRSAGILLPIFSLPSHQGIGTFGEEAYKFVDFLRDAGQSYWQVLPLTPTSYGDSPYSGPSAFAGNPYFIDVVNCGLQMNRGQRPEVMGQLLDDESPVGADGNPPAVHAFSLHSGGLPSAPTENIDYGLLYRARHTALNATFAHFSGGKEFEAFKAENAEWLVDYCLFAALKDENPERVWQAWDEPIKRRDPAMLASLRKVFAREIEYHAFVQFEFQRQWDALKAYANNNGVRIIGDIPIYVAADSADVWANPELFELDANYMPTRVAGCPPDEFCADGQVWGNPLYQWDAHKKTGYKWWISRMARSLKLFDVVRIDHFRGFESFFAIPAHAKTAKNGVWEKGPGKAFIKVINEWFNSPPVIAENLGFLTPAVEELLKFSGFPGMRVLQFGFSKPDGSSEHLPHNYERHLVAYTGTHDNDTSPGYFKAAPAAERQTAKAYLGIAGGKDTGIAFARAVLNSGSDLAIIPMQDYLNLGSKARLNIPSTLGGNNWRWRVNGDDLSDELAKKIRKVTALAGRAPTHRST